MAKHTYLITVFTILLLACNTQDKPAIQQTAATIDSSKTTTHHALIAALKRVQTTLASNNKEKIAGLFGLPLPETALSVYIEDSLYEQELRSSNGKITKAIFMKHYDAFAEGIWLNDMRDLLQQVSIDSLAYSKSVQYTRYSKNAPCYKVYTIKVTEERVTLEVSMKSNRDYISTQTHSDELPENDSAICEHIAWWTFRFDGQQLYFERFSAAD